MDEYFFFLSYAREDGDQYLAQFKKDLEAEVRARTTHRPDRICFRDRTELDVGDVWLDDLSDAIRTCRVFVPVLTLRYFTKDFCGREWAAFQNRIALARAAGQDPRLIVPVLWIGKDSILPFVPKVVGALQFDQEKLPGEYSDEGLRYLYKINKYESEAQQVVAEVAKRIVKVAPGAAPHLPGDTQLDRVESAWKPSTTTAAAPTPTASGPRFVQFIFVASSASEIRGVRQRLDPYGSAPIEWKPFAPDVPEEIALIAQAVAADQKLIATFPPFGPDLVTLITEAEQAGTLVAVIVDTWTLRVGGPRLQVLKDYDGRKFVNCAVFVPWNPRDQESVQEQVKLEQSLLGFLTKTKTDNDRRYFVDQIISYDQFKGDLTRTLAALRAQVANFASVQKQALNQNGQTIARPII